MNLPKFDISALPDLDTLTGLFGSIVGPGKIVESDDSIIVLMVYLFELTNPNGLF